MHYPQSGTVYRFRSTNTRKTRGVHRFPWTLVAVALVAFSVGGMIAPFLTEIKLELAYQLDRQKVQEYQKVEAETPLPPAVPVLFDPLVSEAGEKIVPIDTNFGIVVPKIGINASVLPNVDPSQKNSYADALTQGVAHAATSFLPDQDGTVYLFSHSTNYDWFVDDLNAIFYLLKNLETDDLVVVMYQSKQYTYRITDKQIVPPTSVEHILPQPGPKRLILQTCWPPGSTTQRLLIFAELIQEVGSTI